MPVVSAIGQNIIVGEGGRNSSELQSVGVTPNGQFLVAWTDFGRDPANSPARIGARLYDSNGIAIGTEIFIAPGSIYAAPTVTALTDNTFLVAWNDGYSHHAQRINADGTKIGEAFNYLPTQDVTALPGGQYVSVWIIDNPEPNDPYDPQIAHVLRAQVLTGNGTPVGSELSIATLGESASDLKITSLTDDRFIVTWKDSVKESDEWWYVVRAQLFNVDGTKIGSEFDASPLRGYTSEAAATSLADGGFLVSWIEGRAFYAQLFRPDGEKNGPPLRIDSDSGVDSFHSVELLDNGRLAFTWTDESPGSVHVRVTDADGSWIGEEFVMAAGGVLDASLASLPGGRFVVAWTDNNNQVASAQMFSAAIVPWNLTGTAGNDLLEGDRLIDTLSGAAGDDWLRGFGGNDTLDGGDGEDTIDYADKTSSIRVTLRDSGDASVLMNNVAEDTVRNVENIIGGSGQNLLTGNAAANFFVGGAINDVLVMLGGSDIAIGEGGNDYLYMGLGDDIAVGGVGVDVLLLESGNDEGQGGDGQDYIFGGDGDDSLFGEAGVDVLQGEAGDDYFDGGSGSDYIYGGIGNDLAYGGVDNDPLLLGNDIFVMEDGDDEAYGDVGQDYFYMGNGNDYANGGEGVDVFLGGAGNDQFEGGPGVDYAWGEAGNDGFIFSDDSGVMVIQDFTPGGTQDHLFLSDVPFDGFRGAMAAITYYAGMNTSILTIDADTAVWLVGVRPNQLTTADFLFFY